MKISVIIPVFNASKYIRQCIDSVKKQTYKNWELFAIDDGSQDDSLRILREIEQTDSRITVLHQENAGAGQARNAGISVATGDYIVFIDSDDIIINDYFEKLSKKGEDIVFIDAIQVDENHKILKKESLSTYSSRSKDEIIRSQMTGKFPWAGWRKAVKLDLLKQHNIWFGEEKVGEEAVYSFKALYYAKSYSFINHSVYEYTNRKDSLSSTMNDDPLWLTACNMKKMIEVMNLSEIYGNTINGLLVTACVVSLDRMARKYNYSRYRERAHITIAKYDKQMYPHFHSDLNSLEKRVYIIYYFIKLKWVFPVYVFSKAWDRIKKR